MKQGTWAIVGATLILLGVGVVSLGFLQDEQAVRQVWDVLADPAAHGRGEYVLIGVPQPSHLKAGLGEPRPNPEYRNETRHVEAWTAAGITYHTTHIVTVVADGTDSVWTYTNHTQLPGRPDTAIQTHASWRLAGPHTVFLIQGFPDDQGETPWLWGVYHGTIREAVQPKPSQFRGHVADVLGDVQLPRGALVYQVTEFTAGCSSKFLPDEYR